MAAAVAYARSQVGFDESAAWRMNRCARATLIAVALALTVTHTLPAKAADTPAANRGLETVAPDKARVTGKVTVNFGSRLATGATGVDVYKIENMTTADLMVLNGTIQRAPERNMTYSLTVDVFNPKTPGQVAKEVAIMRGDLEIDFSGRYLPEPGKLRLDVVKGQKTSSNFRGVLKGREIVRWWDIAKQLKTAQRTATKIYSRAIGGKVVSIEVKNPDPLGFDGLVLAAGPFTYLPETTVRGSLDYDYELGNWLTDNQGLKLSYQLGEKSITDTITGSIRFVEEKGSATVDGKPVPYTGYYEYSLRYNEVTPAADQAFFDPKDFAAQADAFFDTADQSKPGIYGRAYFEDSEDNCKKAKKTDDSEACVGPTKSVISYDLKPVGLTYAQLAAWMKIEPLVIGPFTDE